MLEQTHPPYEIGNIEIQRPVVLMQTTGNLPSVDQPLVQLRCDARDDHDDPRELHVNSACRAPRPIQICKSVKIIVGGLIHEREAEMEIISDMRRDGIVYTVIRRESLFGSKTSQSPSSVRQIDQNRGWFGVMRRNRGRTIANNSATIVFQGRGSESDQIPHMRQLGHDIIACLTTRVGHTHRPIKSNISVFLANTSHEITQRGVIQTLFLGRTLPNGKRRGFLLDSAKIKREHTIGLLQSCNKVGKHLRRIISSVMIAHVIQRIRMMRAVEHVASVLRSRKYRIFVNVKQHGALGHLVINVHQTEIPLSVKKLYVFGVREKGHTTRETKTALVSHRH